MARLRTYNRRRFRKLNPLTFPMVTWTDRADGTLRCTIEAVRAGRWVSHSPMHRESENDFDDFCEEVEYEITETLARATEAA